MHEGLPLPTALAQPAHTYTHIHTIHRMPLPPREGCLPRRVPVQTEGALTAPAPHGRGVYARALGTHYAIFAQLEDSLNRHSGNETFKATRQVLDALRSTASFERDLKVRPPLPRKAPKAFTAACLLPCARPGWCFMQMLYGSAWRSIIPRHQGETPPKYKVLINVFACS